jgi:hypothetical protein
MRILESLLPKNVQELFVFRLHSNRSLLSQGATANFGQRLEFEAHPCDQRHDKEGLQRLGEVLPLKNDPQHQSCRPSLLTTYR